MKKLALIFIAVFALFLSSCENPAKSRILTEEGSKQLLRYSEYKKAEETLTKAIQYDKNNYEAYYYRGCARVNAMKYNEAIADFEKAIALKPDFADAYFNMGCTYFLMKDLRKLQVGGKIWPRQLGGFLKEMQLVKISTQTHQRFPQR